MGTLNYRAPEPLCDENAEARSDIFALGAIIVEALTAPRPFTGKSYAGLLNAVRARRS